jgi:hypothetical protein
MKQRVESKGWSGIQVITFGTPGHRVTALNPGEPDIPNKKFVGNLAAIISILKGTKISYFDFRRKEPFWVRFISLSLQ